MRKGFIFNFDLCVNCKACSAACFLENKWDVTARNIYTYNSEILPDIPVTNLSLACNHCAEALCLVGCPTGAYFRDETTSAIIIQSDKCIGCSYCTWNCPYDAPKINLKKGTIEKCNLCNERILEGIEPACTEACPTGALRFGEIPEIPSGIVLNWVPDKKINPAIQINGSKKIPPLRIIPETNSNERSITPVSLEKPLSGEWSLILFSFLSILSVSLNISALLSGSISDTILATTVLIIAGLFSIFHLNSKHNAWKAILNIKKSPLSREIVLFIFYSIITIAYISTGSNGLLITSVVIGFLFLIAIDNVYTFADRSFHMILHSGQAFMSGLLISSYLAGSLIPFIFIASIKIILNAYYLFRRKSSVLFFNIRFVRIVFLLIISGTMIFGVESNDVVKFVIFLSGEFADRILYYADFNPININSEISKHIILSQNEKESG